MGKSVMLDASVTLELLFKRARWEECVRYIENCNEVSISALTVHIVYYFAKKERLSPQITQEFLSHFEILPLTNDTVTQAEHLYKGKDFEDALQIACYLLEGKDAFLTLDKNLPKRFGASGVVCVG